MIEQSLWVPRRIDKIRRHKVHNLLSDAYGTDVSDEIMAVFDKNPSAHLPYHGTPHLLVVALAAHRLSQMENCYLKESDTLLLAAMFHDYNHQLNDDDSVNVASAVEAVKFNLNINFRNGVTWEEIADLIEATRYPHVGEPRDRMEAILRDADILYSTILVPDAQYFRNGLKAERGTPATELESLSFIVGHGLNTRSASEELHEFIQIGVRNAPTQYGQ